jgi:hypothetical protein
MEQLMMKDKLRFVIYSWKENHQEYYVRGPSTGKLRGKYQCARREIYILKNSA